jgi:hypothetical protein
MIALATVAELGALRRPRQMPVRAEGGQSAKFEDRYDALVELLNQEEAEPTRKAVKPLDTGNNAHFTVI